MVAKKWKNGEEEGEEEEGIHDNESETAGGLIKSEEEEEKGAMRLGEGPKETAHCARYPEGEDSEQVRKIGSTRMRRRRDMTATTLAWLAASALLLSSSLAYDPNVADGDSRPKMFVDYLNGPLRGRNMKRLSKCMTCFYTYSIACLDQNKKEWERGRGALREKRDQKTLLAQIPPLFLLPSPPLPHSLVGNISLYTRLANWHLDCMASIPRDFSQIYPFYNTYEGLEIEQGSMCSTFCFVLVTNMLC